jgi:hypothetical protein
MGLFKKSSGFRSAIIKVKPNDLTEQERLACMEISLSLLTEQEAGTEEWLNKVRQIWPSEPVNFMEVLSKLEVFSRTSMAVALYNAGIRDIEKAGKLIEKAFANLSESEKELLKEDKQDATQRVFVIFAQRLRKVEEILAGLVEPERE